ncbi:MAG: efflux RND transporter periplasmic adaptor subunit, partial [Nevskiales bacterium]
EGPLFVVTDLSSVWVELSLFPRNLAQVRVGQAVRVHNVDGGIEAQGQIVNLSPLGQTESQTLTARVLLANPDKRWAPGLYVTAEVTLSESEVPVAVLSTALQTVENRSVVFVSVPGGFRLQPVVTARSDGEYTEVVSGLAANSRYVAANSFVLKSELGKGEADHGH